MVKIRKILARGVAAVAGVVYDLGCWLFVLEDRIGGPDEESTTKPEAHMWSGNDSTTSATGYWTISRD